MPIEGATVTIDVLVEGGGSGLFPQATLRDASGAALGESPLDLSHLAGSVEIYRGTFVMPATQKVTGETQVYNDAGHTTLEFGYPTAIDEFFLSESTSSGGGDGSQKCGVKGKVKEDEQVQGLANNQRVAGRAQED